MKKPLSLILPLLFFAVQTVSALQLFLPPEGKQGEVFTVLIADNPEELEVRVSLANGDDIYASTAAFSAEVDGTRRSVAVLGIPSTLSPGKYTVKAASGDDETEALFLVIKKEFIEENIALSKSMTTLRKSDDIRKAEQWRSLYAILKTVNPSHVFENGPLIIPVAPLRRTSFFGDRRTFDYDDGTSARSIHNGVDYSAVTGTPIYAAGSGKIVFSDERILTGLTVVIEHLPGVYSLYYHMNSLNAEENAMVESGRLIGTVGATGLVTGAHLHWEVRVAGVAVDPEALVNGGIIDKDFILSSIE